MYLLNLDEDAVICDIAETYGVFDYKSLDVGLLSILVTGLPPESRIKQKLNKEKIGLTDTLLAGILDSLNHIAYMLQGKKHGKHPASVLEMLRNVSEKKTKKSISFSSPEEFERRRKELLERS